MRRGEWDPLLVPPGTVQPPPEAPTLALHRLVKGEGLLAGDQEVAPWLSLTTILMA